jgi:hypothetical protein
MKHILPLSPLRFFTLSLLLFLLASCTPTTPTIQAEPLRVQYTFAAQPWLADLNDCAGGSVVDAQLRAADYLEIDTTELAIRIGVNSPIALPAYQIDTEDILVIVHPQNPINRLSAEDVRGLFSGSIQTWQELNGSDEPVQVWVFAAGEDVQQVFEQTALGGTPVVSTARLATGPDEMAQAIADDVNAVGILTRHWKAGNVSDAYTVVTVPVLVILPAESQGAMTDLVACLQK